MTDDMDKELEIENRLMEKERKKQGFHKTFVDEVISFCDNEIKEKYPKVKIKIGE